MSTVVVKTIIKFKRGLASEWRDVNPILQVGEPGFETDTNKLKIGNGINTWNELPYISGSGGAEVSADGKSISIRYVDGVKTFYLYGFNDAAEGEIPMKSEEGVFQWVNLREEIDDKIEDATYSKSTLDTKFAAKQDKLIPGENIVITEDNVISATGGGGGSASVDNKSIELNSLAKISIKDYEEASQGQMLVKDRTMGIAWVNPVSDATIQEAVRNAQASATQAGNYAVESGNQAVISETCAESAAATLVEVNRKIWFGTRAQYNALEVVYDDSIYCITDEA